MRRRELLTTGLATTFAYTLGGATVMLTPREARAQRAQGRVFTPEELDALDVLGDGLVPGAAEAGFAHYLDAQLARPSAESLLMIRYLDVPPPYEGFYRDSLHALQSAAIALHDQPLRTLDAQPLEQLIGALSRGAITGWSDAPPQQAVYFVLRADAVDVTYGTETGFARLGIDYLPHIRPRVPW